MTARWTMQRGPGPRSRATLLAVAVALGTTACAASRTQPSTLKEPAVALCSSRRDADGGLTIIAAVQIGLYPVVASRVEYRVAAPSDPPPIAVDEEGTELALQSPTTESVSPARESGEIAFRVSPAAVRGLGDKLLWYRWILTYDRNGSERTLASAIHRTSAAEAGLPRAADVAGPDASVALPLPLEERR